MAASALYFICAFVILKPFLFVTASDTNENENENDRYERNVRKGHGMHEHGDYKVSGLSYHQSPVTVSVYTQKETTVTEEAPSFTEKLHNNGAPRSQSKKRKEYTSHGHHEEPRYDSHHEEPHYESHHEEPRHDSHHEEPRHDSHHEEPRYDSHHESHIKTRERLKKYKDSLQAKKNTTTDSPYRDSSNESSFPDSSEESPFKKTSSESFEKIKGQNVGSSEESEMERERSHTNKKHKKRTKSSVFTHHVKLDGERSSEEENKSSHDLEEPKFKFTDILRKFKEYKADLKEMISKIIPSCPEVHALELIQRWSLVFKNAWPHFKDMRQVSMNYAEDLRLQLVLCLDQIIHKKFGNDVAERKKSPPPEESEERSKVKRQLEDQEEFMSKFNSEMITPLVNMFAKMPEMIESANSK